MGLIQQNMTGWALDNSDEKTKTFFTPYSGWIRGWLEFKQSQRKHWLWFNNSGSYSFLKSLLNYVIISCYLSINNNC